MQMEKLTFSNECLKGVAYASRRIGIKPEALVRVLNSDVLTLLIEAAMQAEDAAMACPDDRLFPGLAFQNAAIQLGKALDLLTDISLNNFPDQSQHEANDNSVRKFVSPQQLSTL